MVSYVRQRPAEWFAPARMVFLVWALMGCWAFYQHAIVAPYTLEDASPFARHFYAALPGWYDFVFGAAVGCGLGGAIALFRRSALARPLFALSFTALIVQFGYVLVGTDLVAQRGLLVAAVLLTIVAVGALQLWLASYARRRGWIS